MPEHNRRLLPWVPIRPSWSPPSSYTPSYFGPACLSA